MFEAVNSSGVDSVIDLFQGMCEDVGQIGQRVDPVRFAGLDQ
jgi:hypothetical protein